MANNYRHIDEMKRFARSQGWSKQKTKSIQGQLLSMDRVEAAEYMRKMRRKELNR